MAVKRNSLSFKTNVLYVVLTILIISIFNFIIWENQSDLITRNQQLSSESLSNKIDLKVRKTLNPVSKVTVETYRQIANAADSMGIKEVRLFTENGKVLYQKTAERRDRASNEELVLINRAVAKFGLEDKSFYHEIDIKRDRIELFVPIAVKAGEEMIIWNFSLPMLSLQKEKNILLRLCILVGAIVIVLQILFALFLQKIIIRPIARLEKLTHEVSEGRFDQTIEIKQDDEIGRLSLSFNEMLRNLIRIRDEAKGANPLSGLPGNNVIVKEIDARIATGEEFAVIYSDLDNFKAYNDKYGFSKGDDAILYTRDCFVQAVKKFGNHKCFIGHEGGDDFVIISPFEDWEGLSKSIVTIFDQGVAQFYNQTDARVGFIDSVDRQGRKVRYPLMSISLAVVSNHFKKITDHRQLVAAAAEMKKFVKKTEGSTYAIDRRKR